MKIFTHIIDTFVPRGNNHFHPHLLRPLSLTVLAVFLLVVQVAIYQVERGDGRVLGIATSISENEILQITNKQRLANGAPTLANDKRLQAAAQNKANDMAKLGYWSHISPEGIAPWHFIDDSGYEYEIAGENLARGFKTSSGVVTGWMKSPSHRDNLLDPNYQDVGIATANGQIEGEETTIVVALYGTENLDEGFLAIASDNLKVALGDEQNYSLINPLPLQDSLDWASRISLPVLGVIGFTQLSQHVVLKRKRLKWDKHTHSHPLLILLIILVVIAAVIAANLGTIL